ncbi:Hypothetical protein CKL_1413 [Clostridium kluyveri DSM 555]|uniref:Uncharacterized protein n=1 Tax=Clostridium kluyveri (strain ATCC 8527 / DSM 555 / NBRC 12016 / NCIMB 10680 / K1) TaxID=431943 RepID=A5N824_CLOK5|nr:Hypothetical protein CKL_1413 [Clostridium kluyveri DSM 555]
MNLVLPSPRGSPDIPNNNLFIFNLLNKICYLIVNITYKNFLCKLKLIFYYLRIKYLNCEHNFYIIIHGGCE